MENNSNNNPLKSAVSPREHEVIKLVATGLSNKEVATGLGIAEKTVKFHLSSIFKKLNIKNRVQLVLKMQQGATNEV